MAVGTGVIVLGMINLDNGLIALGAVPIALFMVALLVCACYSGHASEMDKFLFERKVFVV